MMRRHDRFHAFLRPRAGDFAGKLIRYRLLALLARSTHTRHAAFARYRFHASQRGMPVREPRYQRVFTC